MDIRSLKKRMEGIVPSFEEAFNSNDIVCRKKLLSIYPLERLSLKELGKLQVGDLSRTFHRIKDVPLDILPHKLDYLDFLAVLKRQGIPYDIFNENSEINNKAKELQREHPFSADYIIGEIWVGTGSTHYDDPIYLDSNAKDFIEYIYYCNIKHILRRPYDNTLTLKHL